MNTRINSRDQSKKSDNNRIGNTQEQGKNLNYPPTSASMYSNPYGGSYYYGGQPQYQNNGYRGGRGGAGGEGGQGGNGGRSKWLPAGGKGGRQNYAHTPSSINRKLTSAYGSATNNFKSPGYKNYASKKETIEEFGRHEIDEVTLKGIQQIMTANGTQEIKKTSNRSIEEQLLQTDRDRTNIHGN